jgi:hypothetical protein
MTDSTVDVRRDAGLFTGYYSHGMTLTWTRSVVSTMFSLYSQLRVTASVRLSAPPLMAIDALFLFGVPPLPSFHSLICSSSFVFAATQIIPSFLWSGSG